MSFGANLRGKVLLLDDVKAGTGSFALTWHPSSATSLVGPRLVAETDVATVGSLVLKTGGSENGVGIAYVYMFFQT